MLVHYHEFIGQIKCHMKIPNIKEYKASFCLIVSEVNQINFHCQPTSPPIITLGLEAALGSSGLLSSIITHKLLVLIGDCLLQVKQKGSKASVRNGTKQQYSKKARENFVNSRRQIQVGPLCMIDNVFLPINK